VGRARQHRGFRPAFVPALISLLVLGVPARAESGRPADRQAGTSAWWTARSSDIGLKTGFQDIRFGHLQRGRALVAADFDLDGRVDFYSGNPGDESYVLHNLPGPGGIPHFEVVQTLLVGELAFCAAVFDYDNDGDPDIFVGEGGVEGIGFAHLFKNGWMESGQQNLSFEDVTHEAGVAGPIPPGHESPMPVSAMGVVAADYDRDGWTDVFVSVNIADQTLPPLKGRNILWHNNGNGTFTDVTDAMGLGVTRESTRFSTWIDYDNDGDPDLYENDFDGYTHMWQNRLGEAGQAQFVDVTQQLSPPGQNLACPFQSFASAAADFNNDGWQDLAVFMRWHIGEPPDCPYPYGHAVFMNLNGRGFVNVSLPSGIDDPFVYRKGVMGCQAGDVNGDGSPDVYIGNGAPMDRHTKLGGQYDQLFLSTQSPGRLPEFANATPLIDYPAPRGEGIRYPPYPYRTHGTVFTDVDGDGTQEIVVAEGGPAALGDFNQEPDRMFKLVWNPAPKWFIVRAIGDGQTVSTDAIGTRFAVTAKRPDGGTFTVHGTLFGGNCFSAGSGPDVYFGLSNADRILSLEIDWPDGTVETRTDGLIIDSRLVVERGHMMGNLSRRMGHVSNGAPAQVRAMLAAHPAPPTSAAPPLPPQRGILFSCG
jgi:hypothetical protein